MSFWNNDRYEGLNESDHERRKTILGGGESNKWSGPSTRRTGLLIVTPLRLLAVGWLFILPFYLNHDNASGSRMAAVGKTNLSYNENVIFAADQVKPAVVSVISLSEQEKAEGTLGAEEQLMGMGSGIIFRIENKKA